MIEIGRRMTSRGLTTMDVGCLEANSRGRAFYEALGGEISEQRLFDDEGVLLPEVVYRYDLERLGR